MSQRTKNILSWAVSVIMIMVFVAPFLTQAQSSGTTGDTTSSGTTGGNISTGPIKIINPFKCPNGQASCTISDFIKTIVNEILIPIGGVIAVLMIIYAGFLYVTARGNSGKIETAHKALLWAVIGAAILLGAWVISNAISATVDQLKSAS